MIKRILLILLLASCKTPQHIADDLYHNHPEVLAKSCADRYPPVITPGGTDTQYIKGDPVVFQDTVLWVSSDTVYYRTHTITNRTDTLLVHDTVKVADGAWKTVAASEQTKNAVLTDNLSSRTKIMWWAIAIGAVSVISFVVKLFR